MFIAHFKMGHCLQVTFLQHFGVNDLNLDLVFHFDRNWFYKQTFLKLGNLTTFLTVIQYSCLIQNGTLFTCHIHSNIVYKPYSYHFWVIDLDLVFQFDCNWFYMYFLKLVIFTVLYSTFLYMLYLVILFVA